MSSLERMKTTKNVMNQSFNQRFFNELEINGGTNPSSPSKRPPAYDGNSIFSTIDARR